MLTKALFCHLIRLWVSKAHGYLAFPASEFWFGVFKCLKGVLEYVPQSKDYLLMGMHSRKENLPSVSEAADSWRSYTVT